MARYTNAELCALLRSQLTTGAETAIKEACAEIGLDRVHALHMMTETKAWRSELWKLANEIERRLIPQPPVKS